MGENRGQCGVGGESKEVSAGVLVPVVEGEENNGFWRGKKKLKKRGGSWRQLVLAVPGLHLAEGINSHPIPATAGFLRREHSETLGWAMLCNCCYFINEAPYPSLPRAQAADGALSPATLPPSAPASLLHPSLVKYSPAEITGRGDGGDDFLLKSRYKLYIC